MQSKKRQLLYIIVDRAAEGKNTVHFLNQVDEADLMALMEGDSGKAQAPAVCTCKDKCKTAQSIPPARYALSIWPKCR